MKHISPQELIEWTHGQLVQGVPCSCTGVFTDSRRPLHGGLFVALHGDKHNGHDYLAQVAENGAVGALIALAEREKAVTQTADIRSHEGRPFFLIAVPDTLSGLQQLARGHRRKFRYPVIGLTGSNGKTTTKEMLAACLRRQIPVLATERNYNNDVGVPLTLLSLSDEHRACIVEMGMRGVGQIARLAAVAEPDVGVITNVGPVHLELLGTIENVASAKAELVAALPGRGVAVLNGEDPLVAAMARQTEAQVIYYGLRPSFHVYATQVQSTSVGSSFQVHWGAGESADVRLNLPGRHNVLNALAALAAVQAVGYDIRAALPALGNMPQLPMRMERSILPNGSVLINDAYNAGPASMQAALEQLRQESGRRVAVLGDMLELGADSAAWHEHIGRLAAAAGVRLLIAVGAGGKIIADAAVQSSTAPLEVLYYPHAAAAAAAVDSWLATGDVILLKASRGVHLELVAEALIKRK